MIVFININYYGRMFLVIKMKVISGKYKGTILKGVGILGTRPTMDRVKESVFAMIQDYVKDAVVLDLYSGTGNLAIEAISNGAKKAYLVDNAKDAISVIKENVNRLRIDNVVIIKDNARNALNTFIKNDFKFNIIFLDPPYESDELDKILRIINQNVDIISSKGIIVCETTKDIDYSAYNNLISCKNRKYNHKTVNILQKRIY